MRALGRFQPLSAALSHHRSAGTVPEQPPDYRRRGGKAGMKDDALLLFSCYFVPGESLGKKDGGCLGVVVSQQPPRASAVSGGPRNDVIATDEDVEGEKYDCDSITTRLYHFIEP